jgi:hypothetical protein
LDVRWISFHLAKQARQSGSRLPLTVIEGTLSGLKEMNVLQATQDP